MNSFDFLKVGGRWRGLGRARLAIALMLSSTVLSLSPLFAHAASGPPPDPEKDFARFKISTRKSTLEAIKLIEDYRNCRIAPPKNPDVKALCEKRIRDFDESLKWEVVSLRQQLVCLESSEDMAHLKACSQSQKLNPKAN